LNDDIQNLEKEIKVIKEKNEELELDNRDNRARIKAVKDDHENKNLLMVIIDFKLFFINNIIHIYLFNLIEIIRKEY
jgi:hypothetical protein